MLERKDLPLTLTLSPQAGRGDVPRMTETYAENGAAYPSPRLRGEGSGSRMRGGHARQGMNRDF
jgi:hypothetical protein